MFAKSTQQNSCNAILFSNIFHQLTTYFGCILFRQKSWQPEMYLRLLRPPPTLCWHRTSRRPTPSLHYRNRAASPEQQTGTAPRIIRAIRKHWTSSCWRNRTCSGWFSTPGSGEIHKSPSAVGNGGAIAATQQNQNVVSKLCSLRKRAVITWHYLCRSIN